MRLWTLEMLSAVGGAATDGCLLGDFMADWFGDRMGACERIEVEVAERVQRVWDEMEREGELEMKIREDGYYDVYLRRTPCREPAPSGPLVP